MINARYWSSATLTIRAGSSGKGNLGPIGEICTKHNILVISDEIHAEMAYPQYTHYPFASVSDTAASCSVTFMAPSKTFNIAGIVTSYAIVPNDRIREEFYSFLEPESLAMARSSLIRRQPPLTPMAPNGCNKCECISWRMYVSWKSSWNYISPR